MLERGNATTLKKLTAVSSLVALREIGRHHNLLFYGKEDLLLLLLELEEFEQVG